MSVKRAIERKKAKETYGKSWKRYWSYQRSKPIKTEKVSTNEQIIIDNEKLMEIIKNDSKKNETEAETIDVTENTTIDNSDDSAISDSSSSDSSD